mmetsp:Transcript_8584/g.24666  ORF Transcript_8584/g.24666 Transcript_8584/m.24666 type:complete len:547 (-) Transcript_8584:75-1715(-)
MANPNFRNRDDYRRQMELEEARKAGLAPAAVDEDGKEINPHIPQYMSSAPWYLNQQHPSLKHQKDYRDKAKDDMAKWYDRGAKTFQAKKYRKGACENCGAMTHKTKDCVERPRARSAKITGKFIASDEKVESIEMNTFEGKRDRWNGYDGADYERVVDKFEKVEKLKKEIKKKAELERKFNSKDGEAAQKPDTDEHKHDGDESDEDRIDESEEAGFAKVEKRLRTTGGGATGSVRNLRIREDTAKYLLNLDVNSAHYDPKTRSMRADPLPHKDPAQRSFAGDNFVRKTGDYQGWEALNLHSWKAYDKGQDIHLQGVPSQAEALFKNFKEKKKVLDTKSKKSIEETYGNAASDAPEDMFLFGQTEKYVEYDRAGRLIKGTESKATSKYEEDVYINNHTSVWGSWWQDGQWGFTCCKSMVKNSYCTGAAGIAAAANNAENLAANLRSKAENEEKAKASKLAGYKPTDVWGEASMDGDLDQEKLQAALKKQEAERSELDDRKRGYNSLKANDTEVTPEEMEAYRMKKSRGTDDPMDKGGATGTDGYDLV